MKFTQLYEELKFSDVFPAASKEEAAQRREQFVAMKMREMLNLMPYKTKLPDGTWHIHYPST